MKHDTVSSIAAFEMLEVAHTKGVAFRRYSSALDQRDASIGFSGEASLLEVAKANSFGRLPPSAGADTEVHEAGSGTATMLASQKEAEAALDQMKGCRVEVEGVDDVALAFLMSLPVSTVREIVAEWHHGLGFPVLSRLSAIKERLDGARGRRQVHGGPNQEQEQA